MHGEEQVSTIERAIIKFPNQKRRTSQHQCIRHWACIQCWINGSCHDVNQLQKDSTMIQRSGHCKNMTMMIPLVKLPPLGYVKFEYQILEGLKYDDGNLFRLWYELLRPDEKVFSHTFMTKAQQKIEYRWDDFLTDKQEGKTTEEEPYEPVKDFDPRFHYYDSYVDIVTNLPEASTKSRGGG